jgi:hypothetical protein
MSHLGNGENGRALRSVVAGVRKSALWLCVLALALIIEHFVVYRGVIGPAQETSGEVPPWAFGALFAPELVACFAAGWQLRSWRLVAVYAVLATVLREVFQAALRIVGEAGHDPGFSARIEPGVAMPLIAGVYVVILAVASVSGRGDAEFDRA